MITNYSALKCVFNCVLVVCFLINSFFICIYAVLIVLNISENEGTTSMI